MDDRIFLSPPHMTGKEFQYLYEAFHSNWIAPLGQNVDGFERELCRLAGSRAAAALSSGSAAIFLGLKALGVKPGDRVLCSDLTFAGGCFPIEWLGAEPVFIDSSPQSCNMSPEALTRAFEELSAAGVVPRAAVIADLYGIPAEYEKLLPICRAHRCAILEDAAEALGSAYRGRQCGTFGDLGVFSFNGNKIITTSGGGAVLGNDLSLIEKIRFWSTQAREPLPYYEHREIGYNFRLSNICAAIGRGQLEGLLDKIRRRREIREFYIEAFRGLPLHAAEAPEDASPNCWLSVFLLEDESGSASLGLVSALAAENIEARPCWKPMHEQPVFAGRRFFSHSDNSPAESSRFFRRGICLPSGDAMTQSDLDRVSGAIRRYFHGAAAAPQNPKDGAA